MGAGHQEADSLQEETRCTPYIGEGLPGAMGSPPQAPPSRAQARRMAGDEAGVGAQLVLPAGARGARPGGVEADARDLEVDVAGVGVDRDPLALARLAPGHQRPGGQRTVEQARGGERERDGAGAVVARVLPLAVAAAPLVRGAGDRVAGLDDLAHGLGRLERRQRDAVGERGRLARPAAAALAQHAGGPAAAGARGRGRLRAGIVEARVLLGLGRRGARRAGLGLHDARAQLLRQRRQLRRALARLGALVARQVLVLSSPAAPIAR